MEKKESHLPENIEFDDDALVYFRINEAKGFLDVLSGFVKQIQIYDSSRLVIIETWLLLDYSIRHLILAGLGISQYETENFSLKDSLLPRSFIGCLNLLIKLRDHNYRLPEKPPTDPFEVPMDFISFVKEDDDDLEIFKQYSKLTSKYCHQKNVRYISSLESNEGYRFVPSAWIEVVNKIDKEWRKKAEKLNTVRNIAAHSHDEEMIAEKLGIKGAQSQKRVKKYCFNLLEELFGFRPN